MGVVQEERKKQWIQESPFTVTAAAAKSDPKLALRQHTTISERESSARYSSRRRSSSNMERYDCTSMCESVTMTRAMVLTNCDCTTALSALRHGLQPTDAAWPESAASLLHA